jgi:hypothetical protein
MSSIPDHIRDRLEPPPARVASTPDAISPLSRKRLEALEARRLAEMNPPPPPPTIIGQTHERYRGGARQITGLSARALARRAEQEETQT